MIKPILSFLILGLLPMHSAYAQTPLTQIFRFVNLPPSARISAWGGYGLAFSDSDVGLGFMNPASLSGSIHHQMSFQSFRRFGDTKGGDFLYGNTFDKLNTTLWGGVHYIDYGTFTGLDELGNSTSSFSAKERAFTFGTTKHIHPQYTLGVGLKYLSSTLDQYQSSAFLGDAALLYRSEDRTIQATVLFKNMGIQTSSYAGQPEALPFEILTGFSKKLQHLPFKYNLTYRYLNRWNLQYYTPGEEAGSIFSTPSSSNKTLILLDNLARHLVVSGEFFLGKKENFRLRFGYNHLRRKDLSPKEYFNLTGLSFGFGFKVYHFGLDYGYAIYHQGGNVHHFGINANLSDFYSSKSHTTIRTGSIGEE